MAQHTIYKYPLPQIDDFILLLPKGAVPLSMRFQGAQAMLWCEVDRTQVSVERRFELHGTGHPFRQLAPDLERKYVDTADTTIGNSPFVLHLYEIVRKSS